MKETSLGRKNHGIWGFSFNGAIPHLKLKRAR
jgi:hypothetical protein